MKIKVTKLTTVFAAILTLATIFALTGCSKTQNSDTQEIPFDSSDAGQAADMGIQTDAEIQTDADTVGTQEQGAGTGIVIRTYSDTEKARMAELKESYQNETAKPEKMIPEVGSAADITEGTLCYIISAGEYYLPDRELTDEELLEIIDCNFRIAVMNGGAVTEEEKAAYYAEIARLEKIVQDNNGISVDEAVEIARKQLETDIGDAAALEIMGYDGGGAAVILDTTEEIFEGIDSKADVAYQVGFGSLDTDIIYSYIIDAVDGTILSQDP